jgi:hypothetical protein
VQAENKGIEAGNAEMRKQIDEAKKKLGYS